MKQYVLGILLLLVPWSQVQAAPGSADIFTADYSSVLGNWSGLAATDAGGGYSEPYTNETRVAGGGPHGLDAFQTEFVFVDSNQVYLGHTKDGLGNPSTGVSRFYRWYEYHETANNYRPADGGGNWVLKRLILGNGAGNRMILNVECDSYGTGCDPRLEVIFDGHGNPVGSSGTFSKGAWHAIQAEVRYDGASSYIKVWLDTDTYASPTIDWDPGSSPTNTEPGYTEFGNYSNDTLHSSGVFTFRDAAFRVATTFDSNWYGWLQNGDGGAAASSVLSGGVTFTGSVRIQ